MRSLRFGVNGWVARVGDGFDESSVVRIAAALGQAWAHRAVGSTVMVGYDTRRDSLRLALVAGQVIAAQGLDVVVSDRVCPTPALSWSIATNPRCVGGVMLTASEASCEYGGLLVRQHDGGPLDPVFADRVEQLISSVPTDARASVERADLVSSYLDNIAILADSTLISGSGLRVVVDGMYGATAGYAGRLFERLGCEVINIHEAHVPDFRGLHPDAREPWVDECERAVMRHRADLGIVFDGDGDRMGIIDARGRLVSQHDLAPLVLEHVVGQRGMRGRVVSTVASSVRFARHAERLDLEHTMVPVGFDAIYGEFSDGDVILATEEYGGICVPPHLPERDGLAAATMIVELMAGTGESVRDMVDECERQVGAFEYVSKDVRLDFSLMQRLRNVLPGLNPPEVCGQVPLAVTHPSGLRVELPDGSWALVRLSRSRQLARCCAEVPAPGSVRPLLSWAVSLARSGGRA